MIYYYLFCVCVIYYYFFFQTNIQKIRQTNFKMPDGNSINNGTTGKTKPFQKKKKLNLNTCSKVMVEHLSKEKKNSPNCITFLSLKSVKNNSLYIKQFSINICTTYIQRCQRFRDTLTSNLKQK